ncbi:MAG: hypothetical protein ACLFQK_06755 [Fibrobacterota bacterium]
MIPILIIIFSGLFFSTGAQMQEELLFYGVSDTLRYKPLPDSLKGGWKPFVASMCLGPRVGLEYNEGIPVTWNDCILTLPMVANYNKNQAKGCIYTCFIGPRAGLEADTRKLRTKEKILLASSLISSVSPMGYPAFNIIEGEDINFTVEIKPFGLIALSTRFLIALEAASGKTMKEISKEEDLYYPWAKEKYFEDEQ